MGWIVAWMKLCVDLPCRILVDEVSIHLTTRAFLNNLGDTHGENFLSFATIKKSTDENFSADPNDEFTISRLLISLFFYTQ